MTEANAATIRDRAAATFGRLVDALADPARAHRTAAALIAGYVTAWWFYALVAKGSQDIHSDMGEIAAWALVPAWGYPKHPPFPAWVAAVWFSVFPHADWSFYLLSAASIGVALWFVWLIAARILAGPKRALALALLTFSPVFNFQPLKFNSNALLIPVWAAASYLFLRSFAERSLVWGALAGAAAAAAMLTKYWSAFLILGFVAAALSDRRRGDYLRSPAPWASVIVGAALLAPNIVSLAGYDFQPFRYATVTHAATGASDLVLSVATYLSGVLYLAGGAVALWLACRPDRAAVGDMLWPGDSDRRLMAVALYTALLAPLLLPVVLHTKLAALWTMPMWALLPALLLSSSRIAATRRAAIGVLGAACAVPLLALAVSPLVALAIQRAGSNNYAAHYRLAAQAVEERWRVATDMPLRVIGSYDNVLYGTAFYLRDRPLAFEIVTPAATPWVDEARIARDGIAMVCPVERADCVDALVVRAARSPGTLRSEVELARSYFGSAGAPARFTIAIIPPQPQ